MSEDKLPQTDIAPPTREPLPLFTTEREYVAGVEDVQAKRELALAPYREGKDTYDIVRLATDLTERGVDNVAKLLQYYGFSRDAAKSATDTAEALRAVEAYKTEEGTYDLVRAVEANVPIEQLTLLFGEGSIKKVQDYVRTKALYEEARREARREAAELTRKREPLPDVEVKFPEPLETLPEGTQRPKVDI